MPESGLNRAEQEKRTPERSVEDARRRGWFWHWNTIITQYAPLVGLKGVGLLNSYTVWTDRREESPHHGYAFPTQQAEADFYGEDRAELITINKILVALGLIEIRKEMVTRVDERGRRWRVPHNLYRVRDQQDGYNLQCEDVLRVVELAAADRAVYRYIRRIFSPRFSPIDAENVWQQMLPELRQNPGWQALAERAAKEDARASARTKAGHAKRSKATNQTTNVTNDHSRQEYDGVLDTESPEMVPQAEPATSVDDANKGFETAVGVCNSGLEGDVEPGNNALGGNGATIADQRNEGDRNSVELGNSTYNQTSHTTTTTTGSHTESNRPDSAGSGPLLGPSLAVVACFEAANDRAITPLEADLLAELERAFASSAQRSGETGADWVVAAIREAVGSGSRFVAPKRIKEILNRWSKSDSRHGLRPSVATTTEGVTDEAPPDFLLPAGRGAQATWEHALRLLSAVIERTEMERFFAGSGITGYQAGTVRVRVSSREAAERLSGEYYELVSRKLAEAMRRPVRIEFSAPGATPAAESEPSDPELPRSTVVATEAAMQPQRPLPIPNFMLAGGLTNQQIWRSALEVLAERVSAATWQTWLRPAALIGADEDGTLVLGAPSAFARQRLSGHLLDEVARVLAGLLARPVTLRVVVTQEWLRQRASDEPDDDEDGI